MASMARIFKVSERVVVDVKGFEPWPATIETVVFEEEGSNVSYHVKLDGSSKSVPFRQEKIKLLGKVDEAKWKTLSLDERWHGARKRLEVIEGVYIGMFDDAHLPFSLWNYDSVENNHENVSDTDKAALKLSRVAHNAKVRYTELEPKFSFHTKQNKMIVKMNNETDDYGHIVERSGRNSSGCKSVIRFPCPLCAKKFKTRMALKKHLESNIDCADCKQIGKTMEQPQQCPKCFSLYKNEDMLLKHMLVHEKNLPKKKNGIRDFLRQIMSNNKACRVPSYSPANTLKSKANSSNVKTSAKLRDKKRKKVVSPDDSEEEVEEEKGDVEEEEYTEDNSTSDTDSLKTNASKTCRVCLYRQCKCIVLKFGIRNHEIHSEREKERRRQMREEFERLANVLRVPKTNNPKNTLLLLAREEILNLEVISKRMEQALTDLQDMNVRLVTRQYQLSA